MDIKQIIDVSGSKAAAVAAAPGMFPSPPNYSVPAPLTSTRTIQLTSVERTVASWIKKSKTSPAGYAIEEKARHFARSD
jgi:hypothetical protein